MFNEFMRKNLGGINIQKTIFVTANTDLGTSGLLKLWCQSNDGRYRVVDPIMFDARLNAYRPSLLPFKSEATGLIFLGNDKFSKEYRLSISKARNNKSNLQLLDLGNAAPDACTEITVIDPWQIQEYQDKQYAIVHIGLQQYTYNKVQTNLPFIPNASWIDDIHEDKMDIDFFRIQYRNKMRDMQDLHPVHWKLTLKRPRIAICNYRDIYDYDYSMDFANELAIFLERHWMNSNITNAQHRGVKHGR